MRVVSSFQFRVQKRNGGERWWPMIKSKNEWPPICAEDADNNTTTKEAAGEEQELAAVFVR
ncbi:MAG: hypothetical protein ABI383_10935 [Acidobacteriaceae bacterium]